MPPLDERQVCTNAWAFRHWLRATGRAGPGETPDLRAWAEADPRRWMTALRAFAGIPDGGSLRLLDGVGRPGILAVRSATRRLVRSPRTPGAGDGLARLLDGTLDPDRLAEAAGVVLLDADIRPGDHLLVTGVSPWPWLLALRQGTAVTLARPGSDADLAAAIRDERASVLIAPAGILAASEGVPATTRGIEAARFDEAALFD